MHPNEIASKNPRKAEKINSADDYAADIYPGETGEGFKYRVMQIYASGGSQRQQSAEKTNEINYFRAKYTFPSVFFK